MCGGRSRYIAYIHIACILCKFVRVCVCVYRFSGLGLADALLFLLDADVGIDTVSLYGVEGGIFYHN